MIMKNKWYKNSTFNQHELYRKEKVINRDHEFERGKRKQRNYTPHDSDTMMKLELQKRKNIFCGITFDILIYGSSHPQ